MRKQQIEQRETLHILTRNGTKVYCTCNECDRIIYVDELTLDEYNLNGGYCPACRGVQ